MKGWLYDRVAEDLEPFGLTPQEYVCEMVAEVGPRWTLIWECLMADIGAQRGGRPQFPNPATLRKWAA